MRRSLVFALAAVMPLVPSVAKARTMIEIDQVLKDCQAAGNGMVPGIEPVQSDLKRETSLVGMAYLNYIYQTDIANRHFCESMLLMNAQIPAGAANPYVALFTTERAATTMAVLADIQLAFDYAIARTSPPVETVKASLDKVRKSME